MSVLTRYHQARYHTMSSASSAVPLVSNLELDLQMKIEDLEKESGANNMVSPGHVSEGARVCALCRGKDANIGMTCHRAPGTYRLPATVINVTHCLLQASTVKHKINQTKNQSSTPSIKSNNHQRKQTKKPQTRNLIQKSMQLPIDRPRGLLC